MKIPPSSLTSQKLEELFKAGGYVEKLFYPPTVPAPPLKLEDSRGGELEQPTDKTSNEAVPNE